MAWKYHKPEFEFSKDTPSSWWGHVFFAYDLVANIKPKRIVELGTHYGVSFFSMCQAVKDFSLNTSLHAVDTWLGDAHAKAGYEEKDLVFNDFRKSLNFYCGNLEINLHRKLFDEALGDFPDDSIDFLHIDGYHTYDAVKHDFESWLPKMKKDGIILLHDIHERKEDFGVYKLWEEIKERYDTLEFYHWHGLGIVFLAESMKVKGFLESQNEMRGHYSNLADAYLFNQIKEEKKKYRKLRRGEKGEGQDGQRGQNLILPKTFIVEDASAAGRIKNVLKKGKCSINIKHKFNSSRKNNIAVYTAIIGDYDSLNIPQQQINGCDFYCFTDNKKLKSNFFKIINIERQFSDPTRDARKIKVLSHEYLPDYEYSLWIDGHILFEDLDVEAMIERFLARHDFAIHKHRFRNCVYDEFLECIKINVDSAELMSAQIVRYIKEGYPIDNGLAETGVLFRRNTDLSKKINEDWWDEIKNNSKRDQLSVNYAFWKNNAEYYVIDENIAKGRFFSLKSHKNESYKSRKESFDNCRLRKELLRLENREKGVAVERIKKRNELLRWEIKKKEKSIEDIMSSRPFLLGDLLLRSFSKPWKILTFPINAYKILNNKKQKNAKSQ